MNVITVMLIEEQFGTLVAAATTVRDQAKACASTSPMPMPTPSSTGPTS
ncbi:hypothetical protein [Azohydromonas australica]|nr:hypothetical protein [Azohydromonas australica]